MERLEAGITFKTGFLLIVLPVALFTDILVQKNNSVDRVLAEINDADGREQFRLDDVGKKLFAQRLHSAPHLLAVKHPLSFLTPSFVFQSADMTGWVSCSRHGDANDHDEAGAASSARL